MKKVTVKVEEIRHITHDVLQIDVEKPARVGFKTKKGGGLE